MPGILRAATEVLLGRAGWYVHRLRAMSVREVSFRVGEQLGRVVGRLPDRSPAFTGARRDSGLGDVVLKWGADPQVRRFWQESADAVARGVVEVFGTPWPVSAAGVPDWDRDPLTGQVWPGGYCFAVATDDGPEEVKHVWELNRLVHLLPVAAHAASAGDRTAVATCRTHLDDWLTAHPPRQGVVWRSGIELAIRIVSFVVVLELVGSLGRDDELERRVARAVAEHVDWIRRFPSRYSSANNHRVAELAGLLVAGSAYPTLVEQGQVDAWWTEFDQVVIAQFHPDGVPAEQATGYALLVLEWLAICGLAVEGRPVAPPLRERAGAALRFLSAVTDSAGHVVRVGDDDDSRLLTAALPHDRLAPAVRDLVALGLGLTGDAGETAGAQKTGGLTVFADGGYTVGRSRRASGEALWLVDHGPLGFGELAAHGHADTLAVYLHYRGIPVFVDAGTYLYHSGGDWRRLFRSTALHNTVTVGGADSSRMTGPFNWHQEHRAVGRLLSALGDRNGWAVTAEHHGYEAEHGVVHRRVLEDRGAGRVRLSDRLTSDRPASLEWTVLLAPEIEVADTDDGWSLSAGGTALLRVGVPQGWRRTVRKGGDDGGGPWFSGSFGRVVATSQLVITGEVHESVTLEVDIDLLDPADPEEAIRAESTLPNR